MAFALLEGRVFCLFRSGLADAAKTRSSQLPKAAYHGRRRVFEVTMSNQPTQTVRVLATDLDGTLIPLEGNEQNRRDLETLAEEIRRHQLQLLFVTGRHFQSVADAMVAYGLPRPDWVICDVGTSMYERDSNGSYRTVAAYYRNLQQRIASLSIDSLQKQLESLDGLRLQESEKQGEFKLSYYTDSAELTDVVRTVERRLEELDAPYSIISSIDPFTNDGLIDLLPENVSKASALTWWVEHANLPPDALVFAGDSGNDLAALTAGYRAIVVANAPRDVAEAVREAHHRSGWSDRLFLAEREATSGVLDGCRQFGFSGSAWWDYQHDYLRLGHEPSRKAVAWGRC